MAVNDHEGDAKYFMSKNFYLAVHFTLDQIGVLFRIMGNSSNYR